MSENTDASLTDHAMLVVWGQYAHCLGLIQALEKVSLAQKSVNHTPQSKVLEFLVVHLARADTPGLRVIHRFDNSQMSLTCHE